MFITITREAQLSYPRKITADSDEVRNEYALKCQSCGACCTFPRIHADGPIDGHTYHGTKVTTYQWELTGETETTRESGHWMRRKNGRCAALKGELGERVNCQIYSQRPMGCRVFDPGSEQCIHLRKQRGYEA